MHAFASIDTSTASAGDHRRQADDQNGCPVHLDVILEHEETYDPAARSTERKDIPYVHITE